ncbi:MAG: helix-turn-helix transcriptional regulator [Angustibacter sp.]
MPDLPTDWWTTQDVADFLGIAPSTVRAYATRHQMPEPDRRIGRMALWRPITIQRWRSGRPRAASSGW